MASPADADHIADLFSEFGPVSVRRMFGGAGIFADGLMIGIVSDGTIFLKADASGAADFEREGCGPFTYPVNGGERTIASYWRMPDRLYDDPGELAQWARKALAAARAGANKSPRKSAAVKKAKPAKSAKPTKSAGSRAKNAAKRVTKRAVKKPTRSAAKKPTAKSKRRRRSS